MQNFSKFLIASFIGILFFQISRSNAQIIVPRGWESQDSLRFELFNYGASYEGSLDVWNRMMDTLQCNWGASWGDIDLQNPGLAYKGKRKGGMFWTGAYNHVALSGIPEFFKQRIFYALPRPLPFRFDAGYFWRYNDVNIPGSGAQSFNNSFDANDISPFTEYPQKDAIVQATFTSRRNKSGTGSDVDTFFYGNEGRVILGYSDNWDATQLFYATGNLWHPELSGGTQEDTAHLFSANLEFNIDESSIDTSISLHRTIDSLPLIRLQILFKKGDSALGDGKGWKANPFVPFKESLHPNNPGWWRLVDTVITKKIYDSLPDLWRIEDKLANGAASHSWHFKQLHVQLAALPDSLKYMITHLDYRYDYGGGSADTNFPSYIHPDSIHANDLKSRNVLEMRVLSTYRAKIRVRALTYQDTIVDKFLYRKLFVGDVKPHSCNPDGTRGGYDDTLIAQISKFHDSLVHYHFLPWEFLYNDTHYYGSSGSLAEPMMGYVDFLCYPDSIYSLYREQDAGGGSTQHLRRARMSHDAVPISIFENQVNVFSDQQPFPGEYMYNFPKPSDTTVWPNSPLDTMIQTPVTRIARANSDSLIAYKKYDSAANGLRWFNWSVRTSANEAMNHPKGRQFAIETSIQGWGLYGISFDTVTIAKRDSIFIIGVFDHATSDVHTSNWRTGDSVWGWNIVLETTTTSGTTTTKHYGVRLRRFNHPPFLLNHQRQTTPEETQAMIFCSIVNGAFAVENPQPLDFAGAGESDSWNPANIYAGDAGLCGLQKKIDTGAWWTNSSIIHDHYRNSGHPYMPDWITQWPYKDTADACGDLPPLYLGYSNSWLAHIRAISRVNAIYDTTHGRKCLHPLRKMTWMGAYSTDHSLNFTDKADTATYNKAFLKCFCTTKVDPWKRGDHKEYIDSIKSGSLVPDDANRTFGEVGLFRDSTSPTNNGYAALVVNTRLYPTLNDPDDSTYYNKDLTHALDRSRSIFGDIDVRKVWFKIDTNQFVPTYRTQYYVVRDLWHPDSTWLVKNDSSFAVYIKPGDAKFLYIEKGISIQAAKTATLSATADFAFNNGRRVAERMKGTRTIETYTRGGKLYVSNASRGKTIPGYNERSDGDNIATGNEVCIDTNLRCARPSICVGLNDTSVAIVYWRSPDQLWAAYQVHPDSGWHFRRNYQYSCIDSSSDSSWVTPVTTPINDSTWIIAASYRGNNPGDLANPNAGIVGARFVFEKGTRLITFLSDGFQYLFQDAGGSAITAQSFFPTVASRPKLDDTTQLADSLFPIRLAWQKGQPANSVIMSERIAWNTGTGTAPVIEKAAIVSKGLSTNCYNAHPSIAMLGISDLWSGALLNPKTLTTFLTWESKLFGKPNSHSKYFPVLRQYTQPINSVKGNWKRVSQVFTPDTLADISNSYRYPIVSANNRIGGRVFNNNPRKANPAYHDFIRLLWGNPSQSIQIEHWENGWIQGWFNELNNAYPSIGQTTDAINHWTDSSTVPLSMAYIPTSTKQVRITNGWSPWIDHIDPRSVQQVFLVDSAFSSDCTPVAHFTFTLSPYYLVTGGTSSPKQWSQIDPTDRSILDESWPAIPSNALEVHTDSVTLRAGDSLLVNRTFELTDSAIIQNSLGDITDTLALDLVLRNYADSSIITTLEHSSISKNLMVYPGHGLDNTTARYKYPIGSSTVTAFITAELKRKKIDSLTSMVIEIEGGDTLLPNESYKRAATDPGIKNTISTLNVDVVPNPFTHSTMVKVASAEGLPTQIDVFDLEGRKVASLFNNAFPASGLEIKFEAVMLSTGSYLLRVQSGNEVVTRKIQLLK